MTDNQRLDGGASRCDYFAPEAEAASERRKLMAALYPFLSAVTLAGLLWAGYPLLAGALLAGGVAVGFLGWIYWE